MQPFDEHEIIREVLSGNTGAFGRLVRQYEGMVLHIATPFLGTGPDREDVCQDIFIRVYEKLHTFQQRSRLSTWIGQIAYNMCINAIRKKKPQSMSMLNAADELHVETFPSASDTPEEVLIREDQLHLLGQCIQQLTAIQQTTLLLFYKDEMSLEEISEMISLPMNTVKSHLHRARAILKNKMTLQAQYHGKG